MNSSIIQGIIWTIIVVIAVVLFFTFLLRPIRHWNQLEGFGKPATIMFTVLDIATMIAGGYFAYHNYTYQPRPQTKLTKSLKATMKQEQAEDNNRYKQRITMKQYQNDSDKQLYKMYTAKGQADIDSYADNSPKTKSLLLHNVGRVIRPGGDATTRLETISGAKINLCDGKPRLLVFCDGSRYSLTELEVLNEYNQSANNDDNHTKINYVVIFPTLDGTAVSKLFDSSDDIGDKDNLNIVTVDSMPTNSQNNVRFLTMNEYQVKDVPSVIAIDKNGVICNAGVGSTFTSQSALKTFLSRSFNASSSLYREIK